MCIRDSQYGTGRDMLQFQAINKLWLELGSTATFGVGNLCWVGSYFSSQRLYGDETQYLSLIHICYER